jgi:hypothetical protein
MFQFEMLLLKMSSSLREKGAPQMYVPYSQNEIKIWPPMQTIQVALRTGGKNPRAGSGSAP